MVLNSWFPGRKGSWGRILWLLRRERARDLNWGLCCGRGDGSQNTWVLGKEEAGAQTPETQGGETVSPDYCFLEKVESRSLNFWEQGH